MPLYANCVVLRQKDSRLIISSTGKEVLRPWEASSPSLSSATLTAKSTGILVKSETTSKDKVFASVESLTSFEFFGFHSTIQLYIYVTSTLQLFSKFNFARHRFIHSGSFYISPEEEKCICHQGNYRVSFTSLVNPLDSCFNTMVRPVVAPRDFGLTITWFVLSASGTTSSFTLTSPVATFTEPLTLTWDKLFILEVKS